MSDSKSLNDWMHDWEALQRQYLAAWSEVLAKAPGASTAGVMPSAASPFAGMPFATPTSPFGTSPFGQSPFATPFAGAAFAGMPGAASAALPNWQEGLDQWSRFFADSSQSSDTAERLLASAKSYMAMIQSMFGAAGAQQAGFGGVPTNPAQAWFESLRKSFPMPEGMSAPGFSMPGMDASTLNHPFAKALRDMAGQGAKGFTEMPAAFAPFVEQLRQDGLSWLKIPAFGVGREQQEHYQKTALAFIEYQQALQNYNALMAKASQRGFELFEVKLAERGESMRAIDSLRALYDLWVDAAEEAYAEIALSEEFAKVYGELANAQMRARSQVQVQVEKVSTDLGMPTRSELNSVHKRLHELRRELRDNRQAQIDTSELEAQVAALRDEVKELKQSLSRKQKGTTASEPKSAPMSEPKRAAAFIETPAEHLSPVHAAKRPRGQRRVRVPATRPRAPLPIVKPRPAAATNGKSSVQSASFGDAIAAMRERVSAKSGKRKSVAASVSKPSKQHLAASFEAPSATQKSTSEKRGKRAKRKAK